MKPSKVLFCLPRVGNIPLFHVLRVHTLLVCSKNERPHIRNFHCNCSILIVASNILTCPLYVLLSFRHVLSPWGHFGKCARLGRRGMELRDLALLDKEEICAQQQHLGVEQTSD